ncbi:hypothetical protein LOTGIDRAFT_153020 [Lottia gigantea]|uniref:Immunoglobulin domain-containing protein n=1 Tax=Lottia gigantea TaxID=225164 RepID=V4ALD1_LOTGI|nr:hypothetical protein LOTGIDRAFT_153020 [Lottia gigantea]ESO97912.1 hypothetical protein LOTGIDRAFT_153020 [Lottia gigantea]
MFTKLLLISGLIANQVYWADSSITVRYKEPYEIKCGFDEIKEHVKWIYNGLTVFSCEAPYRAGECKIQDDLYRYEIDNENKKMAVKMHKTDIIEWKETSANWTCRHSDQEKTYSFDHTESPQIFYFNYPENLNLQSTATVTVGINSTIPYTITWSSNRRGVIKIEEFKNTHINNASIGIQTSCRDNVDTFLYSVENGASFPCVGSFNLTVRCETIVLEDEMDKTIEVELGQDAVFRVLFAGDRKPTNITWYRRMSSMITDLKFLTDYRIKKNSGQTSNSMEMTIYSVQKQDVGTYTAELSSESKKILIDFELVVKSKDSDPPFSWYIGIVIGAVSGILVCIVIFIAVMMIKKIKSNGDDYLTPKSVPQTPPPPVPQGTPYMGSSTSNYNDSAFSDSSENYENMGNY